MSEQIGYTGTQISPEELDYPGSKASINIDWKVEQRKLTALNLAIQSSSSGTPPEEIIKKAKAFQKFLTV